MVLHIDRLIHAGFYQLHCLWAIHCSITMATAIQIVNSFIVTCIDYCNSLLVGLLAYQLDQVQSVLNYAAYLVYGHGNYDHVIPLLHDNLHWLRIPENDVQIPQDRHQNISPISVSESKGRSTLRSAGSIQYKLVNPWRVSKFAEHSFSVSALAAWNWNM